MRPVLLTSFARRGDALAVVKQFFSWKNCTSGVVWFYLI